MGERGTEYGTDVDIRRSMVMGRDLDMQQVAQQAPMLLRRGLHWGPVWSGVVSSLVIAFLLTCLFLGLGFTTAGRATATVAAASFSWPAGLALAIGVFIGGYLTGFTADLRSRTEGVLDGFVVGVMTILIPVGLSILGIAGRAGTVVGRPLLVAGYAWGLFIAGVIVLALATVGGWLGYRSRERAISHELRMMQANK